MAGLINRLEINGKLQGTDIVDSGALQTLRNASGSSHLPATIDRTAIHYDTTDEWNSKRLLVGQKSHIYVYSDFKTVVVDGEEVQVPGIKIGDGNSYLIDLPFVSNAESQAYIKVDTTANWGEKTSLTSEANTIYVYMDKDGEGNVTSIKFKVGDGSSYLVDIPFASPSMSEFEDHINDRTVHVTTEEKTFWNNKWRGYMDVADGENLYFTTN